MLQLIFVEKMPVLISFRPYDVFTSNNLYLCTGNAQFEHRTKHQVFIISTNLMLKVRTFRYIKKKKIIQKIGNLDMCSIEMKRLINI